MAGSIFVVAEHTDELLDLAQDMDKLDDFDHVEMDYLLTLDFEAICAPARIRWSDDTPIAFDEVLGLAIARVTPEGLEAVLAPGAFAAEHDRDVGALRAFVEKHQSKRIYEVSTF